VIRLLRPVGAPACLLWGLLVWSLPSAAAAHAIVLESSPPSGAVLAQPPAEITLRFNSKIEKRFTRLTLSTGNQPPAPVTARSDDPGTPDRLVIPIRSLAPGEYTLRYRVLAVDGHITEGALRFTVEP
jgi:methionine-rich copper-binding protein CopC